ncbi:MAG: hypothetical protein QOG50_1544, partial [Actinomycetota bacterium]|nr:hypothetical protein [Actinomycetota bacterium]
FEEMRNRRPLEMGGTGERTPGAYL